MKSSEYVEHCPTCGIIDISYNSCRNRNCPKCGFEKKIKWLYHRKKDVLPITYYHVVFRLPEELNPLFLFYPNQKLMILRACQCPPRANWVDVWVEIK
ncbi:MAG: transposase zinc-binding domain-containing protein [Leptospiraceae bacterium]|nr:transposase zinc-binding domain-containing protein [Leptospiraceae bacterium]